ncbi:MAG: hypothetical protein EP330_25150 [Deltaproteobacteria bacterium]|nr:MAG: hypothetical protein EP330_25150 [Deltaproteobacteria bacterium]
MTLTLLALAGLAWGQDPWGGAGGEEAPWDPAPETPAQAPAPAPTADSPWDAAPARPAPVEASPWKLASAVSWESPWMKPAPSPWMLPVPPPLDLAPWWRMPEPDPWAVATREPDPWGAPAAPAPQPVPVVEPAPVVDDGWGDAGSDDAGWGEASSDEAGWGEASADAAGWGDSDDDAGWGDGDDAAGFGDGSETAQASSTPKKQLPVWMRDFAIGGAVETRESLWVERLKEMPLASARQSLDLELRYSKGIFRGRVAGHGEVDFAYLPAREWWTPDTTQTYGHQVLLREAWVSVSPSIVELAVGRQTVAWGDGLLLSPLDLVAPKDQREPGLAELEDLRLPVTMLRLGAYPGNHRFEFLWVPEFHPGFRSPPEGPYGYAEDLIAQAPDLDPSDVYDGPDFLGNIMDQLYGEEFDQMVAELLAEKTYAWDDRKRAFGPKSHQFYWRWRVRANGVDAGVYVANVLDRQGTIGFPDAQTFIDVPDLQLPLNHYRYSIVGHSGTASIGKFLVRWEQSFDLHKPFNTADFDTQPPQFYVRRGDLMTTMIGVGSSHIPNTQIDIEAMKGVWLKETFSETFLPQDAITWAARGSWTGMREKLRLSATSLVFGADGRYGGLVRGDASYALRDGLWATVGGIHYAPGRENGPLLGFDTHDQLFVQSRFSF